MSEREIGMKVFEEWKDLLEKKETTFYEEWKSYKANGKNIIELLRKLGEPFTSEEIKLKLQQRKP